MVLVATVGVLSDWVSAPLPLPPDGGGGGVGVLRNLAALVDVLGEPAEALAVALPLQHTAHEHLQWSRVQLLHGNVALREKAGKKVTLNPPCSFFTRENRVDSVI